MIYLSEGLLYISFALLMGALLLRLVPVSKRPAILIPDGLLIGCALAIPLLTFVPIDRLVKLYAKEFELSYGEMLKSILLDVHAGTAWIWTTLGSIGLALLLGMKWFRGDKHTTKAALLMTMLLIVWLGYASHASSLSSLTGLVAHTAHFLAFSIWIGILFVISWFSIHDDNWPAFLKWFSPVAIISVVVTLLAGITLMAYTTPQYVNAWILPYGQALLIKHLLILPLLLFAYTNGFLYKSVAARNHPFRPLKWLRIESSIALLVLAATAYMGQQAPPHTLKETLQTVSPSPLFTWLYKGSFSPDITLSFNIQMESLLMFAAAALMLVGVVWTYRANRPVPAILMSLMMAAFIYFGLMFSIA